VEQITSYGGGYVVMSKKKKPKMSKRMRILKQLGNERRNSQELSKQLFSLSEQIRCAREDDVETLFEYRSIFFRRSKEFLRLCLGMKNWISGQLLGVKDDLDEASYIKIGNKLEELEFMIDNQLGEFKKIIPALNTPYNFDEHDVSCTIEDSSNLYIKSIISPGYKLDGRVIKKAQVEVVVKNGGE